MLKKHSTRTVRSGCQKCGSTDLYWYHDTDITSGSKPMARSVCDRCHVQGALVLGERHGTPHICGGRPRFLSQGEGQDESQDESQGESQDESQGESEGEGESQSDSQAPTPEEQAAIDHWKWVAQQVKPPLEELGLKGGATPEEIDKMVADAWSKHAIPTVVHVKRDGEVKPIEGLTHKVLPQVITALLEGEHVMMVGPAGSGKTTIAEQAARALSLGYGFISCSPDMPTPPLLGFKDANGVFQTTVFLEGYDAKGDGGLFLFDELDNGNSGILATMNSALSNGHCASRGGVVKRHNGWRCVASANTYGLGPDRAYVGRQPIDKATLNRFTKVFVGYDEAMEDALSAGTGFDRWALVVALIRKLRKQADEHRMPVVLSPRNSVGVCKLLNAGWTWEQVVEGRIREGMSDGDWSKLTQGVEVSL